MELNRFVLFVIIFSTVFEVRSNVMIRSVENRIRAYLTMFFFIDIPTANKNFMANFTLTDRDL